MTDQPRPRRQARTEADTAVSRIVATNTIRLRRARGLTQSALVRAIQANGHHMHRSSLMRIEEGTTGKGGLRAVTVDELAWIAEALGADPATLLTANTCPTCNDAPPQGFTCKNCGAGADRE